jgi:5-formyltetrahydrofolate cyclo-ligase
MIPATSVEDSKATLRREAMARRDALPAETRSAAAEAIASRPFPLPIKPGTIVSGFMPLKSEINPQPLIMRAGEFGAPLDRGQWDIREPKPEAAAVEPDILLVPLLAFDRAGHRVGYGAGYYDLTITQLRARKPVMTVGLAFAAQEVPAVPATPRDARLDLVLTERELIDLRGS